LKGEGDMTIRVAAYCRVSTDNDDQKNSLESQKLYFEEFIQKNPEGYASDSPGAQR
jgi:DNA invertase Pin-like site-specific DNA recombinase